MTRQLREELMAEQFDQESKEHAGTRSLFDDWQGRFHTLPEFRLSCSSNEDEALTLRPPVPASPGRATETIESRSRLLPLCHDEEGNIGRLNPSKSVGQGAGDCHCRVRKRG